MIELAPAFGILAGAAGVADTLPYLRDMRRGTTRPHRGTWLVWTVLAIGAVIAHGAEGVRWSLLMLAVQAALTTLVLALSMRSGVGGLTRVDGLLLSVAMVGIAGWAVAGDPMVATLCIIGADLLGLAMMAPKTWRDPGSETASTYALAALSGLLATGAVGSWELHLLLYPAWYALSNGALAVVIRVRSARLAGPLLAPGRHPA